MAVDWSGMAMSTADTATSVVKILLVVAAIAIPSLIVWHILRHKHFVTVKILTDNGAINFPDKAREYEDEGVKYWKLLKRKDVLTMPPPDAIQQTKKGKLCAVVYYTPENGYVWARDTVTKDTFKEKIEKEVMVNGVKQKAMLNVYQPFSTLERAKLSAQIRKQAERRGTSWMDRLLQLLPYIVIALIFILILMYWEDIAKPVTEISKANAEISKQNAMISEQNARILVTLGFQNVSIKQTVPPDAGVVPSG